MNHIRSKIAILGIATILGGVTPQVLAMPAQTIVAQNDTEAIFEQGINKLSAKDYGGAIEAFTKVVQSNPKDAEAYYNRGVAYAQLKQYEKAIADYSKVIELSPDDMEAYENRALARAELEDYTGAIADYTQILQKKPDDAELYYNRGLSYAQLEGSEDNAIKDLQKAAELFAKAGKKADSEEALSVIRSLQQ